MPICTFKFRNTQFSLEVNDAEHATKLADRFNQRVASFDNQNNATDLKMAFIAGLMLEDELENLKREMVKKQPKEDTSEVAITVLTDTISQVASYIEQLAQRIEHKA